MCMYYLGTPLFAQQQYTLHQRLRNIVYHLLDMFSFHSHIPPYSHLGMNIPNIFLKYFIAQESLMQNQTPQNEWLLDWDKI